MTIKNFKLPSHSLIARVAKVVKEVSDKHSDILAGERTVPAAELYDAALAKGFNKEFGLWLKGLDIARAQYEGQYSLERLCLLVGDACVEKAIKSVGLYVTVLTDNSQLDRDLDMDSQDIVNWVASWPLCWASDFPLIRA